MSTIRINTITLEELLQKTELDIPVYQRPYSWTEKQLEPLLIDLYQRKSEELLIMGGIIRALYRAHVSVQTSSPHHA